MLEPVGISAGEERLYRTLLSHPQATLPELSTLAGLSVPQVRRAAAALSKAGLLTRRPGSPVRFSLAPPDVAVEALILRRQEELERIRLQAAQLLDEFRQADRRSGADQPVEVVAGRDAISQRSVHLIAGARREVLMFDKPPYLSGLDNPIEYEALRRGVQWRAVYASAALEMPNRMADLRRLRVAGEQARIAPDLPLKLAVADRRLALLPLTSDGDSADRTAIVVRPCSLLDTLVILFELVWDSAIPVPDTSDDPNAATGPSGLDRQLFTLLAAGVKDEVMARQLGVSIRTVRRHIARLMHEHHAHTRFQLGLAAARLDWLRPADPPDRRATPRPGTGCDDH